MLGGLDYPQLRVAPGFSPVQPSRQAAAARRGSQHGFNQETSDGIISTQVLDTLTITSFVS